LEEPAEGGATETHGRNSGEAQGRPVKMLKTGKL